MRRSVTDPRNGKRVALKKMPNVFQSLTSSKRAYRELKMLCFFKHNNVSESVSLVLVLKGGNSLNADLLEWWILLFKEAPVAFRRRPHTRKFCCLLILLLLFHHLGSLSFGHCSPWPRRLLPRNVSFVSKEVVWIWHVFTFVAWQSES